MLCSLEAALDVPLNLLLQSSRALLTKYSSHFRGCAAASCCQPHSAAVATIVLIAMQSLHDISCILRCQAIPFRSTACLNRNHPSACLLCALQVWQHTTLGANDAHLSEEAASEPVPGTSAATSPSASIIKVTE